MKINFLDKFVRIKDYIENNFSDILEGDDIEDGYEAIRIEEDFIEFDTSYGEYIIDDRMLLTFPEDAYSIKEIEKYLGLLKFLKELMKEAI